MDLVKQYSMDFCSEIGACIRGEMRLVVLNVIIDNPGKYNMVFEDGSDIIGFSTILCGSANIKGYAYVLEEVMYL